MSKAKSESLLIEAGDRTHRLFLSERDFGLLNGPYPFIGGGSDFCKLLGIWENTSVSIDMKIPLGSSVTRNRQYLWLVANDLLSTIERDADLLGYDYSFRITGDESRHRLKNNLSGFCIRGYGASVDGFPRGFCTLELAGASPIGRGRIVEIIDLRERDKMSTDDRGDLRIYRSEAKLGWLNSLPALIQFLETGKEKEVTIHHRK